MFRYFLCIFLAVSGIAAAQHQHPQKASGTQQQAGGSGGMDEAMPAMQHRHNDMGPHMKLTSLRPMQPGDQQRADSIVAEARRVAAHYADYRTALADGYRIFLPNLPQKMYHFTNYRYAWEAAFGFNPDHPTSLLYEKTADGGWKLVGVMYTAPARFTLDELNARIPLSIAQWHEHTNFCAAPPGHRSEYFGKNAKFGLLGSISTKEQCEAAGGAFRPTIFGWMVHLYPNEKTQEAIWSVERQMDHGD